MKKLILTIGLVVLIMPSLVYATSPKHQDKILISNIPLAGIIQMITGDIFDIETIDTQNSCPHHYHVKPSDLLKLENAKIAIYIDDGFEGFFKDLLKKFDGETLKVTDLIDITHYLDDTDGENHDHGEQHLTSHDKILRETDHTHHTHANHVHTDPSNYHIWMELDLLTKLLPKIRDYFISKYPTFSKSFDKNCQISIQKINELQKEKAKLLDQMPKLIVLNHSVNGFFDRPSARDKEIIYLHVSEYPSLQLISKLDEYMSSSDELCLITESSSGYVTENQTKISALQLKYHKTVIELNTEKWSLEDNINYSSNFFNQYQRLVMELSKCIK